MLKGVSKSVQPKGVIMTGFTSNRQADCYRCGSMVLTHGNNAMDIRVWGEQGFFPVHVTCPEDDGVE